jgi:hypothetical protein
VDDPLLGKLWIASRILGGHAPGGPFGKPLPHFTFIRGGRDPRKAQGEARAAWFRVLKGKARAERMEKDGLAAATRRLAEYRKRQMAQPAPIVPMITRRGKPVPPDA